MRLIAVTVVFATILSAILLYALSYDTRKLEARVRQQRQEIAMLRDEIAALRAGRARLAQPQRVEPLARALGLVPPAQGQFPVSTGVVAP